MSRSPQATQTAAVTPNAYREAAAPAPNGSPASVASPRDERQDRGDEEAAHDSRAEEPAVSRRLAHDDGQELVIDDAFVVDTLAG